MPMDLSKTAQCARLLAYLQDFGQISTSEARELLAVMSPAARVMELRRLGYSVMTSWRYLSDAAGVLHRQGVYSLQGGHHAE